MTTLLLIICFSVIAAGSIPKPQLEYKYTTEGKSIRFSIEIIDETPAKIRYLSAGPAGSSEFYIDKNTGATLSWKKSRKNKSIFAIRKGNTIDVNVIENGKISSKQFIVDNKIWIQRIALSLQWFIRNGTKERMNFFIIKSDDLSLIDLVAKKRKDVDILIGPKKFNAINAIVTLPGFKSIFGKSDYWFRKKDGLFLKCKGKDGPGSPVTLTELVIDSNSPN